MKNTEKDAEIDKLRGALRFVLDGLEHILGDEECARCDDNRKQAQYLAHHAIVALGECPRPAGYGKDMPGFMKRLLVPPPAPMGGPVKWLEQPLGARFICCDCEFWYEGHRPIEYWHQKIKVYVRPAWLRVAQCEHATFVGLLTEVDP